MADFNLVQPSPVPLTFQTTGDLSNQFYGLSDKINHIAQGIAMASVDANQAPAEYHAQMANALGQLNPKLASQYKDAANKYAFLSNLAKTVKGSGGDMATQQANEGEGLNAYDPSQGVTFQNAAQSTQSNQANIQNTQAGTQGQLITNQGEQFKARMLGPKEVVAQMSNLADGLEANGDANSKNMANQLRLSTVPFIAQAAGQNKPDLSKVSSSMPQTNETTNGNDVISNPEKFFTNKDGSFKPNLSAEGALASICTAPAIGLKNWIKENQLLTH